MFKVMCRVSGGVTGTRTAELRNANGPMRFTTREEAEVAVKKCYDDIGPIRTATFQYWVEPVR